MNHVLAPYPSPYEREQELQQLAQYIPSCELVHFGTSTEGRPLQALRILSTDRSQQVPKVLCSANIHGVEYVASRVAFGLLNHCLNPSPEFQKLRQRAELWVIPCINPDGYETTWRCEGQATLTHMRTNARGVDLNRNFPRPANSSLKYLPGAGSSRLGAATYRGESPLSEPETRSLHDLFADQNFHASINLHAFMGTLIPARVEYKPSYQSYQKLCKTFVQAQSHTRYRRLASRHFDVFTGEQEDYQHHIFKTWAVCVETFPWWASFRQHLSAPSVFWRFNPYDPAPWIANDIPGIIAFFLAALDLARPSCPPYQTSLPAV